MPPTADHERRGSQVLASQRHPHPPCASTRSPRGDLEALRPYFSGDVVWHVAGRHALSGDDFGTDEPIAHFHEARELSGGHPDARTVVDHGRRRARVVMLRVSGERDGKALDIEMAEAFTVLPDGTWSPDDQARADEFLVVSEHPSATPVRTLMGHVYAGELEEALACHTDDGIYRVAGGNLVSGSPKGIMAFKVSDGGKFTESWFFDNTSRSATSPTAEASPATSAP